MSKYWSSMVKRTEPYVPGEQLERTDIIKLNTNENPYPPSPKALLAIESELRQNLEMYPSPTADPLREAIGKRNGLSKDEVFIGNGSDEVLAFSFMAFFEPGETIYYPNITYSFYPVYSKLFNITYEEIALNEDLSLSVEKFFNSPGGVILPNPNAPTSLYAELSDIEQIIQNNKEKVVIIDEAYIDFADASAVDLIRKYDNLLVIQTTSKSRSLAGLRVGFAMGHPELIEALVRVKDSFNSYTIDRLALAGATAAVEDDDYFRESVQKIIETREKTIEALESLGFSVLPSQTNFVFAKHSEASAERLYGQLKEAGILVRHFNKPLISDYLRITIGTGEQMDKLLEQLRNLI